MEGWQTYSLDDLCLIEIGRTPARDDPRLWDQDRSSGNVWLSIADLSRHQGGVVSDSKEYVSDQGAALCKIVPAGTLLLSFKLTLGRLAVAGRPLYTNEAIAALSIREPNRLDRSYLRFFLEAFDWVQASEGDQKVKGRALNKAKLRAISVLVPPLPEQRRIVAILDEAFEALATAKANTERNLQNVRALLDFTRRNIFASLADRYGYSALGRSCTFENGDRGKNYPGKEHRVTHGVPFINAGHLTEEGLDFCHMDYISEERFELLGKGKIRPRDVLFCLRGSLGKFACVDDLARGAIASSLVILRPGADLTTDYLMDFLASTQCAEQIERHKGGAAQPNLGAQDLKRFELPLPPIDVQEATASRLVSLRTAVNDARALLSTKLSALDELKKTLLHQAFTGQLTAKSTDQQLEAVA